MDEKMNEKQFLAKAAQVKVKQNLQTPRRLSITLPEPPKGPKCACGKPTYGDDELCYNCIVAKREQIAKAARIVCKIKTVVPVIYQKAELADLDPAIQKIYSNLRVGQGINLFGAVGTGKTYAMAAICKDLIKKGRDCKIIGYNWILMEVRSTYQPSANMSEADVLRKYAKQDVLFIDDLGVTTDGDETNFSRRVFTDILDPRVNNALPTFVTSNKSGKDIALSFDARVASRLAMACVAYELKGKDRRLEHSLRAVQDKYRS